tara:strand:+ start:521 stop:751 length:231 start_codon:yes stop_codon:yes gene_type:complete
MSKTINININKLQKKYDNAVKNKIDVFIYDGNEILTSYAKYLLEYLKISKTRDFSLVSEGRRGQGYDYGEFEDENE